MTFNSKVFVKKNKLIEKFGQKKYEEATDAFNLLRTNFCSVVEAHNEESRHTIINKLVVQKCNALQLNLKNVPSELKIKTKRNSATRKRKQSIGNDSESDIENEHLSSYKMWKKDNLEPEVPIVSLKKFMLLLNQLEEKTDKNSDTEILRKCVALQQTPYNNYYNSPGAVVRLLRTCVLTRNWNNMTHLLLILLKYSKRDTYLEIIRRMCELLCYFHPLVKENGLDEQFKIMLETRVRKQIKK